MVTSRMLGTSPSGNPGIATQADVAPPLELSVGTEPGVVVVNARASVEDACLGTTLVLNPDAALDLAMRLIGGVGRLRKLEIGERS
jgi:hypothetical protein